MEKFYFKKYYSNDLRIFKQVFARSFSRADRVIDPGNLSYLDKKMNTSYTGLDGFGLVAFEPSGNPIGCVGVYPVRISYRKETFIGAQIGDAGVLRDYRGVGLFSMMLKEIIADLKSKNVDLLFSFPAYANKGSWHSLENAGFQYTNSLEVFEEKVSPKFLARVLRKISPKLYGVYVRKLISFFFIRDNNLPIRAANQLSMVSIEKKTDYISYKEFNNNFFVSLKAGKVWISLKEHHIEVSDLSLETNKSFNDFNVEIVRLSASLGKSSVLYLSNLTDNLKDSRLNKKIVSTIGIMVYLLNSKLSQKEFFFCFFDFDTF